MKFFTRNFPLYFTEKKFAKYFCFMYLIIFYNIVHFKEGILILFSFRFFVACSCNVKKSIQRRAPQKWHGKHRSKPFQFRIRLTFYFIDWSFFPVHAGGSKDFLVCTTFAQRNPRRLFYERTRSFSLSSQNFARLSVCWIRYSVCS